MASLIILSVDYMKAVENTVKEAILLKTNERVLILHDWPKREIAKIFSNACERRGGNVTLIEIQGLTETKREPPADVVKQMEKSNVVLGITSVSLTHTQAVRSALKAGARVATMPGITKEMFSALAVDYKKLVALCKRVMRKFASSHCALITTKAGTNISLWFTGRRIDMDDGLLDKPGSLHNLPAGETGVAPIENSADGTIVVDVCMAGVDKLRNPITIEVKKGKITKISGRREAEKLRSIFRKADRNAKTIAEFSIGTNRKARLIGKVLNDEKAYGTCHFAFGDNLSIGGRTRSNVHLDGVVNRPTIHFDGKIIMKDGKLL